MSAARYQDSGYHRYSMRVQKQASSVHTPTDSCFVLEKKNLIFASRRRGVAVKTYNCFSDFGLEMENRSCLVAQLLLFARLASSANTVGDGSVVIGE